MIVHATSTRQIPPTRGDTRINPRMTSFLLSFMTRSTQEGETLTLAPQSFLGA